MRKIFILLLFPFAACNSQSQWVGGKISKAGVYEYQGLQIIVTDFDHILEYYMLNVDGDTLVSTDQKFSSFQRWAIHLDKDKNLWVFSSDIGDACWERDPSSEQYAKREFIGLIPKDSIPAEVYNTLKEFHPYSRRK